METILLSIGIIFKNDIRCIERCLQSLEPLRKAVPCQLVMADTGSTDGSRAVAERYADVLIDFPWINDFAAARNAVLDRCVGKWYLTVDTDEWLDPECSGFTNFLKSDRCDRYDLGSLIQRNYQDTKLRDYGDFFAVRLGRLRDGKLRYEGAIHEFLFYTDRKTVSTLAFPDLILHHDGYVDVEPKHIEEKRHRNMVLLRAELEKKPHDLRLLLHCVDSAETEKEEREYVDQAEAILKEAKGSPQVFDMIAYQKCTQVHYKYRQMERVLACYDAWKAYSPQSALLRLDGEGMATIAAYELGRYEETVKHYHNYCLAQAEKEKKEDLNRLDRLYAQYNTDNPSWRSNLRAIAFQSLMRLERYEEADQLLRTTHLEDLRLVDRGNMVLEIFKQPERLRESEDFLSRCWDFGRDEKQWEKMGEGANRSEAMGDLIRMILNYLKRTGESGWQMLKQMGDRTPGRSARIVLSNDPAAIAREWEGVTEWTWMFPEAYLHTMEMRLPLPAGFYRQNAEQMAQLAAALTVASPALPRITLDWLTHGAPAETPGELTWQLDLVTAALRTWKWKGETAVGEGLCALYADLSATYLDNLYNPELLNEEDIQILPGMQRFAWWLHQALAAWEQGDELGYVRNLKAGMDTAPAMKDMVEFLLEHKPKTAAQRQLEQLAEQVRAILARYAPDDPSVVALKQSEAYQKVASLLEQQGPSVTQPQTVEAPLSPAPLEEALAGSREEIAASIRENLDRWGSNYTNGRVEYWERYPLWGKNTDEVVENLSAALSTHGADFRWLFDRLGDEQSRRILTAVVRSWRFFEIAPLEAVKDHRYDDYFDLSLLHCDEHEVVADLGAYNGDTFLSYVKNYGSRNYLRYYCYEITKDSFEALKKATAPYPRVVLRRKGAGAGPGTMTLDANDADASSNTLSQKAGDSAETVEVVSLDDDITEPLTFIKMDIEGSEQSALRGCARHIREDRPKLALSVYHNFEDLWKLARMVEELVPGYRFYLRYHGGNLWPSEITLLGIPQ